MISSYNEAVLTQIKLGEESPMKATPIVMRMKFGDTRTNGSFMSRGERRRDMSILHDNELLSYAVDFREKTVLLNTEYWYENINEKTTVIFKNVTAHWFIDAGEMTTIIFDIYCYDVEKFITDYKTLLTERKGYGWPLSGYSDDKDLLEKLNARKQQYFSVESSCGVSGFILAEEMLLNTEVLKE